MVNEYWEKIQQMSPPYEKAGSFVWNLRPMPQRSECPVIRKSILKSRPHKQRQFLTQPIGMAPTFYISVKLSDDVNAADAGSTFLRIAALV